MASLISFSGLASGIDSSSLIKATLDQQRTARVKPLQAQISTFKDTNDSFSKLKELLGSLNTAASKFRTVNGGALSKSAASTDETVATASTTSGAVNGSYTLDVTQLARTASFSFDDRFSASTSVINSSINDGAPEADRTISVSVGNGSSQEDISVVLSSSTTLADFVSSFNAQSTQAVASVINVGTSSSPSYAITIASNNQGTDLGELSVNVGTEITSAGSGSLDSSTITQALDAEFTISGIAGTITKSSNSISDVVAGLTFSLQSEGTATVTVSDDRSATASKMQQFVDAYNAVVNYIRDADSITREEDGNQAVNIFGPLAGTSLDEGMISALRGAFSASGTTGHTVNTLADLGIATQRDGTLKFDSSAFTTAIADDPEGVRTIAEALGENLSAVDGTIAQYTRFNGLIDVAAKSNSEQISRLTSRISDIEKALSREEETMMSRFARLESLIGNLNSQQSALAQVLPR